MTLPATSDPPKIALMCGYWGMFVSPFLNNRPTDFENADSIGKGDSSVRFLIFVALGEWCSVSHCSTTWWDFLFSSLYMKARNASKVEVLWEKFSYSRHLCFWRAPESKLFSQFTFNQCNIHPSSICIVQWMCGVLQCTLSNSLSQKFDSLIYHISKCLMINLWGSWHHAIRSWVSRDACAARLLVPLQELLGKTRPRPRHEDFARKPASRVDQRSHSSSRDRCSWRFPATTRSPCSSRYTTHHVPNTEPLHF